MIGLLTRIQKLQGKIQNGFYYAYFCGKCKPFVVFSPISLAFKAEDCRIQGVFGSVLIF